MERYIQIELSASKIELSYEWFLHSLTFRGFALGRDTERDFYLFEILKLPIKFYVTKCPPDAKDLLGGVIRFLNQLLYCHLGIFQCIS